MRLTVLEGFKNNLELREAAIKMREDACTAREEEARETHRRLNQAAETLRGQWDKLREEKDRGKDIGILQFPLLDETRGRLSCGVRRKAYDISRAVQATICIASEADSRGEDVSSLSKCHTASTESIEPCRSPLSAASRVGFMSTTRLPKSPSLAASYRLLEWTFESVSDLRDKATPAPH